MATHRLYVESDNLQPAVDFLASKPDGSIHILVGGVHNGEDIIGTVISGIKNKQWVHDKIQAGQLSIRVMADKAPIEKNIVVSVDDE